MSQLKRYPEYKDSGVDWIGEIPINWEITQFKRLIKEIKNGISLREKDFETEYPLTRIETISTGEVDFSKVGYVEYSDKIANYKLDTGDILFSHINSLKMIGNSAIYKENKNLYHGVNLLRIKRLSNIDPNWLYYYITSNYFKQTIQSISQHAINQVSVPVTKIKSIPSLLINIEEQKKISDYLDDKTSEIDNLISDKERLIQLLEEKRQAVITETVTKGLDPDVKKKDSGIEWIGDIPEHWEVVKLKFIGESVMGLLYSPKDLSDYENGTLVLRASNIQSGELEINRQDNVYVNKEIPPKLITQVGDILICARSGSRELIGKSGIVDESTSGKSFGAFTTVFRSDSNEYIKYVFQSGLFKSQIGTYLTSTINQLTMRNLNNLEIVHPTKKDQDDIVNYLNKYVKNINKLMKTNKNQILKLKEYRESLIYEAVTGKIDVRDYAVKTEEVY